MINVQKPNYILDKIFSKDIVGNGGFNFNEGLSDTSFNDSNESLYYITKNENDKSENDDYEIYINCVGYNPSDITIKADNDSLKVTSSDGGSKFPNEVGFIKPIDLDIKTTSNYDAQNATAEFKNGVLMILLPKNKDTKRKNIKINV